MAALIIIPAKASSSRMPDKNFRPCAGGSSLVTRALTVAQQIVPAQVLLTTDHAEAPIVTVWENPLPLVWHLRDDRLCQPHTPMVDVIQDVLDHHPDGDPVVLLQPTQPLRTVAHVQQAMRLLTAERDAVVTVTVGRDGWPLERDGTAYVCWRATVETYGHLYGHKTHLLYIPPAQTVNINTPDDWVEAERRVRGAHHA